MFHQRGFRLREGDFFKVTGKNSWWRFIAYVLPGEGKEGYVEAIELKAGKPKNGGVRCLDAGKIREVKAKSTDS